MMFIEKIWFHFLAAVCLITLSFISGYAQSIKDTVFLMDDNIQIAARYYIPRARLPSQKFPAILLIHGYGGSYLSVDGQARLYQSEGYLVLAYTVRGQGMNADKSGGTFSWFTGDREMQDCRFLLEWLRAHQQVNADRVAMEGYSQGGLITWAAMAQAFPIRCAVPVIASPYLSNALYRNGCHNYFFTVGLALTKLGIQVRPSGFTRDTLIPFVEQDNYDSARSLVQKKDVAPALPTITTPLFMQGAQQDDIYPTDDTYLALHTLKSPKKILLYSGGHGLPADSTTFDIRNRLTLRFYDHWLKDNASETIMHPDSMLGIQNGATRKFVFHAERESLQYLGKAHGHMKFYINEHARLSDASPKQTFMQSRTYVQNISNDANLTFQSKSFAQDVTITGCRASLLVNSTGRKYQMNAMLWDVDTLTKIRTPITRGCYHLRVKPDENVGSRKRIEYELSPQLFTIKQGHLIELWVRSGIAGFPLPKDGNEFGNTPYPPQESASDTLISVPDQPSSIDFSLYTDGQTTEVLDAALNDAPKFTVFPNPIRDVALITNHGQKPVMMRVYNILGKMKWQGIVEHSLTLSTKSWNRGVYTFVVDHRASRFLKMD